jgi:alpha-glucosidase
VAQRPRTASSPHATVSSVVLEVDRAAPARVGRAGWEHGPVTTPADDVIHPADTADTSTHWWRDAVVYQIYPRSWSDSDGDGLGDLPGITARLPYLVELGVDAVWVSPFYVSPMHDAGYDVANYRDIDPIFGTLADADAFLARAHELGLRVLLDLVPNHTSSEHAWFQEALASPPGSPARNRYVFREGSGPGGHEPPNEWSSVFGGEAWSRVTEADGTRGQWYLHLFDTTQPDLNWDNPEVVAEFESILRFWLDRGVDGFRVDVAHGLVKAAGLPDWDGPIHFAADLIRVDDDGMPVADDEPAPRPPMWDQDGVHEIYRGWRRVLDDYGPDRILCAEAWVQPEQRLARYVRPDEMQQAFNFEFLDTFFDAERLAHVIEESYRANDAVGAPTTWVLSNHDVIRHASRLGLDLSPEDLRPNGILPGEPEPDAERGLRRARAATLMMLALPGSAYVYQGEELGLPEVIDLPAEARQDPVFARTCGYIAGRDGCRVPMPWTKDAPSFGFGPGEAAWLPQPPAYGSLAVDQQQGRHDSTWELYRELLATRHERHLGRGSLTWHELNGPGVLAFVNGDPVGMRHTLVVLNTGSEPVTLPEGARILCASEPIDGSVLPPDTAVWLEG